MLETLVGGQRVLGAIATVTKLAHVQRVGLLVFVLEMTFQRIVAGKGSSTVRTFLWFINATAGRRWHPELATVITDAASATVR